MHWRQTALALTLAVITGVAGILGSPSTRAQEATPVAGCPTTSPEQNAALVRDYWQTVFNEKDPDSISNFLADDFVRHDPGVPEDSQPGIADDVARATAQLADFPDLHVSIDDLIVDGDKVATRLTWHGTLSDPLEPWGAPATGRAPEPCGKLLLQRAERAPGP